MALGIDFSSILVDLGSQVWQNRTKIDQKLHRKNDEKKMAKKSQFEIQSTRGPLGPDPWGGSLLTERVNPPLPARDCPWLLFLQFLFYPLESPFMSCKVLYSALKPFEGLYVEGLERPSGTTKIIVLRLYDMFTLFKISLKNDSKCI